MNGFQTSEQIDEVADRFEAEWNAGRNPRIETFLENYPDLDRSALLAELIRIDAACRVKQGRESKLEDYFAQFPELRQRAGMEQELREHFRQLATGDGMTNGTETDVEQPHSRDAAREAVSESKRIGRFALLEELGSGSFGTVFRAYDDRLERHVAVKVLRGAAVAGPEERARFLREARSMAQLRHESIVSVHEAGEYGGVPYLVSELIAGTTLQEAMARRRFPPHEAADLVAAVARALDYAHRRGIVHRDVKPSNILLDEKGGPFITDFGLAKRSDADGIMTADGQVLGAPAYMSPEQAAGRLDQSDHRTDVYSLGVVLYEMLTGERPHRGELRMLLLQVQFDEPRPPRRLDDRIPRDLETICLKAMSKEPSLRYQTAGELADDLSRFRCGELIHARPVSSWTRGVRFCRRNWKVVVPSVLAAIAIVTVGVTATVARIAAADLMVAHAQQQEQAHRREVLVERLQRLRLRERTNGWSQVAAQMVGQAASIRRDADLRDFAAATLEGLDARVVKQFSNLSASSVAFDVDGGRLLLGAANGTDQHRSGGERRGSEARSELEAAARLYVRKTDETRPVGFSGPGPVTFTPEGRSLQLAAIGPDKFVLYDVDANKTLQRFTIPDVSGRDSVTEALHPMPLTALNPDGSRVASAVRLAENQGVVIVWDAKTGDELGRWKHPSSAIALAPDGSLLAAGDDEGRITLWSIANRRKVATLQCDRNRINALAFQANPRRALAAIEPNTWNDTWLLAAGETGGTVTIWNPSRGVPVAFCRGGHHWITSVTFSPDATLLAAGAHAEARIWDAATGQLLLRLDPQASGQGDVFQRVSGLAFAPDMSRLAISSEGMYSPPVATVLELQNGRGIRTLRGLSGELSKIRFSPDDRLVAALSHLWEIGIWRVADGRLLRVIDAPEGFSTDNAGLVISPDGRQIGFSAFREARLWDIATGRQLASWTLPTGLQDELAFTANGDLLSLRFETRPRDNNQQPLPPLDVASPQKYPRVCRVRRLVTTPQDPEGASESVLIREFHDFDWHVSELMLATDGAYFAGVGQRSQADGMPQTIVRAFNVKTGDLLWNQEAGGLGGSRAGPLAGLAAADGRVPLFEFPASRFLLRSPPGATVIGSGRRLASGGSRQIGDDHLGRTVYRIGENEPIVTLGIDRPIGSAWVQFSLDETLLAWGHPDGSLQLADLPAIQRELARFGLGW